MKNITLDGYEYTVVYKQATTMNTLCVYKIQQVIEETDEAPVFFLASRELREQFIQMHTFNEMKTHILPQHYEGYFKDEFTAILMAKNVAMDSYIALQKSALEEARRALAEVTEKLAKLQSEISWEGCDAFIKYYDSQDELRMAALKREKEAENK